MKTWQTTALKDRIADLYFAARHNIGQLDDGTFDARWADVAVELAVALTYKQIGKVAERFDRATALIAAL